MGDISDVIRASFESYPGVSLMGFMTVALILALVIIGLAARFIRMLVHVKDYAAALEKIRSIETTVAEMTTAMLEVEKDYEKNLAEEKAANAREVFALQQTIFERNSELLTLKTTLLEMKKTSSYDTY